MSAFCQPTTNARASAVIQVRQRRNQHFLIFRTSYDDAPLQLPAYICSNDYFRPVIYFPNAAKSWATKGNEGYEG